MNCVMLFGLGELGGWVLEFLARSPGVDNIITCDFREDWGYMKTESAAIGAGQQGYDKTIKFEKCDVNNIDATSELIHKYNPNMIYSALTLLGWLEIRILPEAIGPKYWNTAVCNMPGNLILISKLMKARKQARSSAPVLNNSFPDGVNPVLWRNDLGPLVGGGNIDLVAGEIKRAVSVAKNVPFRDVMVYLVCDHAVVPQSAYVEGSKIEVPYFLKIMIGDRDITGEYDIDRLILDSVLMGSLPGQTSQINHPSIAASSVKNIMAVLNDTNEFTHAPGPNGLPGGYPVRINAKGIEVVLPKELSQEEAIKINFAGLKHEGIERINEDGTVVLTEEAYQLQREMYGLDLHEYKFADMEDLAKTLVAKGRELIHKYRK